MHGVKRQGEVAADQVANLIKVEQLLHQGDEVIDAVDHLNLHGTDRVQTGCLQRDRWGLHDRVLLQGLGAVIDRIGERSRRWSTVGTVHLHTEVAVCPAGVVGGGQDDSADGLALANQIEAAGVERIPPVATITLLRPWAAPMRRITSMARRLP